MPTIGISVKKKKAFLSSGERYIVRDNSDYVINFSFDDEWADEIVKTARFAFNGSYIDVPFTGNSVAVPVISTGRIVEVGVFAGDLRTTTGAPITLVPSIRSKNGAPVEPESSVYDRIVDLINSTHETELEIIAEYLSEKIDNPQAASIGDVLTVEEVDENGKPTKWTTVEYSPVDIQNGISGNTPRLFISENLEIPGAVQATLVTPESADDSPFGTTEAFLYLGPGDETCILCLSPFFRSHIYAYGPGSVPSVGTTETYTIEAPLMDYYREKIYKVLSNYVSASKETNFLVTFPVGIEIDGRTYWPRQAVCSSGNGMSALIYTVEDYLLSITVLFNNTGATDICNRAWTVKIKRLM